MTLDEAIAHAREVSEEQRKDNEKCEYKAEYGCKGCADYYSKPCIECAEEHEQLAEWLEELKMLRELKEEHRKIGNIEGFNKGYNKAIDDFKKMLTIEKIKEYAESDGFINLNNCSLMIFDIAEKLKVGCKNG